MGAVELVTTFEVNITLAIIVLIFNIIYNIIYGIKKERLKPLFLYPEDYLFSNQFMDDLERIYRLRKYFPSFEEQNGKRVPS